jgi:hypothetical protein
MANGHGTETPANKIATAQAVQSLAFRLNSEVVAGRIGAEIFNRDVTIFTGSTGVMLPAFPEGTDDELRRGISNIVLIALSASALTVDETLDEVFGKVTADTDKNRVGIRVMVNQLRNAFAHNPWRPKWVIYEKYRIAIQSCSTMVQNSILTPAPLTRMASSRSKSAAWSSG